MYGDELRMTVFDSPERRSETRHTREIIFPVMPPTSWLTDGMPMGVDDVRTIKAEADVFAIHIPNELIENSLHEYTYRDKQVRFLAIVKSVSREIYRTTKIIEPERFVRLDKVEVIRQIETDAYLIRGLVFRTRPADTVNFPQVFQTILTRQLMDNSTAIAHEDIEPFIRIQQDGTGYGLEITQDVTYGSYDKKAEKRARNLLKKMLTKEQFKLYEGQGIVYIRGKSGKSYTIKKHSMIAVTPPKGKSYKLCIEAKNYDICPTDAVIAKIKLIRADEKILHSRANRFGDDSSFIGASGVSIMVDETRYNLPVY